MTEPNTGTVLPETPTLDRLAELREQWDTIRDWMQWLRENGYRLGGLQHHLSTCRRHDRGEDQAPCACEEIASECYGVNPDQCPHRDSHVDWLWNTPMRDRGNPSIPSSGGTSTSTRTTSDANARPSSASRGPGRRRNTTRPRANATSTRPREIRANTTRSTASRSHRDRGEKVTPIGANESCIYS